MNADFSKFLNRPLKIVILISLMSLVGYLQMINTKFHTFSKTIGYGLFLLLTMILFYKILIMMQYFKTNKIQIFGAEIILFIIFQLTNTALVLYLSNAQPSALFYLVSFFSYMYAIGFVRIHPFVSSHTTDTSKEGQNSLETKNTEKNLKLLLNAMDSVTDNLVIILSPNYDIIYLNKAKEDYLFLMHHHKIGKGENIKEILNTTNFSFLINPLQQIFLDKKPIEFEHQLVTAIDGQKDWVVIRILPNYDNGCFLGVTLFFQNISYSKELEFNSAKQVTKLYNIAWRHSHLMRAPLANILGLVHEITKSDIWETKNEQLKILIEYLELEAKKLDKMIRENVISINN